MSWKDIASRLKKEASLKKGKGKVQEEREASLRIVGEKELMLKERRYRNRSNFEQGEGRINCRKGKRDFLRDYRNIPLDSVNLVRELRDKSLFCTRLSDL